MNVAFIPVRSGSKSIPLKNIKPINGHPLVYWTVKAACGCKHIDKVYVATDGSEISDVVKGFQSGTEADAFCKLSVIGRSAESASDTASTESAMLEFAINYEFDNIVLIQATSPLLQSIDLDRGFEAFSEAKTDSVLSVVRQKRFNWQVDVNGFAHPTNYDVFSRPRRQEFGGYLVENGAFYITSRTDLLKTKNRLSGNIKAIEMEEDSFLEIDEPSDWLIIEALMKKRDTTQYLSFDFGHIKMLLTDCDGCLTDGGMYYSEFGDELKKFNTRDGLAFSRLRDRGIFTGIVTSEKVTLNKRRAEKLRLDIFEDGITDKKSAILKICDTYDITPSNIAYVGDDLGDIDVMELVGFSFCPSDAVPDVKAHAKYICLSKGGEGVIREVVDKFFR